MAVVFFFLSMITFSSFSRLHVQRTGAGVWLLAAEETGDHRGASWHQSPHLLCGANGQRHQRRQSSGPAAWTGVHTTGQCAFVPLWAFPFYILNLLSRGSVYKCCQTADYCSFLFYRYWIFIKSDHRVGRAE